MLQEISFIIMGTLATALSILVVTRRLPVTAAMLLIVVMMLLAGMYGVLGSAFPAVAQIIVYAGAIMVVFIFVIMLLNLPPEELRYGRLTVLEYLFMCLGVMCALFFGTKVGQGVLSSGILAVDSTSGFNTRLNRPFFSIDQNVENISAVLFTEYLWAFEIVSFLILAAIVGAIVIAKKPKGVGHDTSSQSS